MLSRTPWVAVALSVLSFIHVNAFANTKSVSETNSTQASVQAVVQANAITYKHLNENPEVKAFIDEMVKKHAFDKKSLVRFFAKANANQQIIDRMNKPYEALAWHRYKKLFTTESHVEQGVEFWIAHEEELKRAEKTFGVPAEIIVAIIGVETRYGQKKGEFKVIDALSTLAFYYPKRGAFFRSELEHFLLLTRELKRDPFSFKGSYAGAMGIPQFISSSYRNFAVDFSGEGKRDILGSDIDAIGSVANYFNKHGWDSSLPIAFKARVKGTGFQSLKSDLKEPKPIYSARQLKKAGVLLKGKPNKQNPLSFIQLELEDGNEYWAGTKNFYVITRYNHSVHYAMAVYQLSQLLKEGYRKS